jgi:hypothetical protein
MKIKLYAAVIISVVIIAVIVLAAPSIKRQLNDWKLLPEPERLSELYFTHPNSLPSSYAPGQTEAVSFTVHNLEYRTTKYDYSIVEQSTNGENEVTLARGSFSLLQNQYEKPAINVQPTDLGSNVKISVNLTSENESIDYLLTRRSA